jgi:hypothetical protein
MAFHCFFLLRFTTHNSEPSPDPSPSSPPSPLRGEGTIEGPYFSLALLGRGLGEGSVDSAMRCRTPSKFVSTSWFQKRSTRYPLRAKESDRRSSTSVCNACCPPSNSTANLNSRQQKSTKYDPIGCCRRNLSPPSRRERRAFQSVRSASVCSRRRRRARSRSSARASVRFTGISFFRPAPPHPCLLPSVGRREGFPGSPQAWRDFFVASRTSAAFTSVTCPIRHVMNLIILAGLRPTSDGHAVASPCRTMVILAHRASTRQKRSRDTKQLRENGRSRSIAYRCG